MSSFTYPNQTGYDYLDENEDRDSFQSIIGLTSLFVKFTFQMWCHSVVFIVNFEQFLHIVLVFPLLTCDRFNTRGFKNAFDWINNVFLKNDF